MLTFGASVNGSQRDETRCSHVIITHWNVGWEQSSPTWWFDFKSHQMINAVSADHTPTCWHWNVINSWEKEIKRRLTFTRCIAKASSRHGWHGGEGLKMMVWMKEMHQMIDAVTADRTDVYWDRSEKSRGKRAIKEGSPSQRASKMRYRPMETTWEWEQGSHNGSLT